MRKQSRRLSLHRETLRHLETPELAGALGGVKETDTLPSECDGNCVSQYLPCTYTCTQI